LHASIDDDTRHDPVEELLLRSGRGDTDAFAELYDLLAPTVFGFVTSLVPDAAAAEATTCEAFVEAWRRSATYDPDRCSATVWVLVVAHRRVVQAGARRRTPHPRALHDERKRRHDG
jgi:DNA-directed RNA polymerase specialized sigma24 family protein